jgi:hypothetical protein
VKGFCPIEKEAEKSTNDALDSIRLDSGSSTISSVEDDQDEEDLSLLDEKKRNKVLARRKKEAESATLKKRKLGRRRRPRGLKKRPRKPETRVLKRWQRSHSILLRTFLLYHLLCSHASVMQLLLACHSLNSSRVPLHLLECPQVLPLLQMSSSYKGPCLTLMLISASIRTSPKNGATFRHSLSE